MWKLVFWLLCPSLSDVIEYWLVHRCHYEAAGNKPIWKTNKLFFTTFLNTIHVYTLATKISHNKLNKQSHEKQNSLKNTLTHFHIYLCTQNTQQNFKYLPSSSTLSWRTQADMGSTTNKKNGGVDVVDKFTQKNLYIRQQSQIKSHINSAHEIQ